MIKDTIVILSIYAQPNARKTEFEKIFDDQLKLKVKAPPEDGRANDEIIGFLADFFSVRKNQISIFSGLTNRRKKVEIVFDTKVTLHDLNAYFRQK